MAKKKLFKKKPRIILELLGGSLVQMHIEGEVPLTAGCDALLGAYCQTCREIVSEGDMTPEIVRGLTLMALDEYVPTVKEE